MLTQDTIGLIMNSIKRFFTSTPGSILIGSVLISLSILYSNGVITLKLPFTNGSPTAVVPAASGAPTASLEEKLVNLASSQGLNTNKFKQCLTSKKFEAEVKKDMADAQTAQVNGTPGFIIGTSSADGNIDGVRVAGAYPYETFQQAFDKISAGLAPQEVVDSFSEEIIAQQGVSVGKSSVDDDAVLGDKNAPITVIEFSDYECPFCKRHFTQVYPDIKKNYIDTGKVKLVFRDFVAVPSHDPGATLEAMAAECVKDQKGDEAYYKFHDAIFTATTSNGSGI